MTTSVEHIPSGSEPATSDADSCGATTMDEHNPATNPGCIYAPESGYDPVVDEAIRRDERRRISAAIRESAPILGEFARSPQAAVELVAYMVSLGTDG